MGFQSKLRNLLEGLGEGVPPPPVLPTDPSSPVTEEPAAQTLSLEEIDQMEELDDLAAGFAELEGCDLCDDDHHHHHHHHDGDK